MGLRTSDPTAAGQLWESRHPAAVHSGNVPAWVVHALLGAIGAHFPDPTASPNVLLHNNPAPAPSASGIDAGNFHPGGALGPLFDGRAAPPMAGSPYQVVAHAAAGHPQSPINIAHLLAGLVGVLGSSGHVQPAPVAPAPHAGPALF